MCGRSAYSKPTYQVLDMTQVNTTNPIFNKPLISLALHSTIHLLKASRVMSAWIFLTHRWNSLWRTVSETLMLQFGGNAGSLLRCSWSCAGNCEELKRNSKPSGDDVFGCVGRCESLLLFCVFLRGVVLDCAGNCCWLNISPCWRRHLSMSLTRPVERLSNISSYAYV